MRKFGLLVVSCLLLVVVLMREGDVVASNEPAVSASGEIHVRAKPVLFASVIPDPERNPNLTDAAVSPIDGDDWLYVVSQRGTIWRVDLTTGDMHITPFLDISDRVNFGGEQGLLSLVFDPNYGFNRRAYVNYIDENGNTVVSRFSANGAFSELIESTEQVVLTIDQPAGNHNGGDMAFGLDGYLYVATGDGGGQGDPNGLSQDLSSMMGKILRIDVADSSGYSVPTSNPFVGVQNANPEIYAYGLRNPWRISFDSATGDLYMGDVGQEMWEEVNVIPAGTAGLNFGWNCYENLDPYSNRCNFPVENMTDPVYAYNHNEGFSISGGAVYRGSEYPALDGHYFFGDFISTRLWSLVKNDSGNYVVVSHGAVWINLTSATTDRDGELYLVDFDGEIYKIEAVPTFPVYLPMIK